MSVVELLRSQHDDLVVRLVTEIAASIPGFNEGIEDASHPLRRQRQRVLLRSLGGLVETIEAAEVGAEADWSEHLELGRLERRYGRPPGQLLRAPWIASRTIIRFINEQAAVAGISADVSGQISEIVVEWSDQISVAFSEGYNDETAAQSSQLEARRQHLIRLALSDPAPDVESFEAAALAAEWRPPSRISVLVACGDHRDRYRRGLPVGSVAADLDDELIALVPASSTRSVLPPSHDIIAALGPSAAVREAAYSARLARRALAVALPERPAGLIDCANCDVDLIVLADPEAAGAFSRRILGQIGESPQLIETLEAWLAHQGRPKATAHALGVHPNTVVYRLGKIRHHLGHRLDDPAQRLGLHLAAHIAAKNRLRDADDGRG